MKLWGGRFESGPSEVFEQFSGSLHFDGRLIGADVEGSQAFARALERAGILSVEECLKLVGAFAEIGREAADPKYLDGATDEDVHTFVIRKLGEKVGALAGKIHTGRSRNEQVSLDTRLYLRASADTLMGLVADLLAELLKLAERYPDAVIPGYTHMRRAQAVLWPHYYWPTSRCSCAMASGCSRRAAGRTCCPWGRVRWPAAASLLTGKQWQRTCTSLP